MKKTIFTGSGVAIVTPFDKNGEVDYKALEKLLDFHVENSTDAIIICGTTGEAAAMSEKEHIDVIAHTVKYINKRIPVVAGTGSNDTAFGIELSKEAERVGADGLLTVTPYYNKTTQKGLVKHFTAIADSVNLPIILYNVPSRTGLNITPATLFELSKVDNIVGIKEASGNISQAAKMASLCPDIDIYSGDDEMTVPVLSLGGKGVISVLANVAPKETHDMVYKFLEGDTKGALKLQLNAIELIDALFIEVNPIPVKAALKLMGLDTGVLRLPLCEIDDSHLEILKKAMINYGIKLA